MREPEGTSSARTRVQTGPQRRVDARVPARRVGQHAAVRLDAAVKRSPGYDGPVRARDAVLGPAPQGRRVRLSLDGRSRRRTRRGRLRVSFQPRRHLPLVQQSQGKRPKASARGGVEECEQWPTAYVRVCHGRVLETARDRTARAGVIVARPHPLPYRRKDYLPTQAERAFFVVLQQAAGRERGAPRCGIAATEVPVPGELCRRGDQGSNPGFHPGFHRWHGKLPPFLYVETFRRVWETFC
jgi:hypothetical protein